MQYGWGTPLCSENDVPANLQGMLQTLKTDPSVTPQLLDQWGNYFDALCPIVGAELHDLSIQKQLAALHGAS